MNQITRPNNIIVPGVSVYLDFNFKHDDDVKSASIILRDISKQLRQTVKERLAFESVLEARKNIAQAQIRLRQGVQFKGMS